MHDHTEFLFAHWAVRALKTLRGARWLGLVTQIAALPPTDPDALAFALTMVDLNGCIRCDARHYRERGGCASCASATLSSPGKFDEAFLVGRFHDAQTRVRQSLADPMNRELYVKTDSYASRNI
jgi:hypothetical protein